MSGWSLRLTRDALPRAAARPLCRGNRVVYVSEGGVTIAHDGGVVPVSADRAWHGASACTLTAGEDGAVALRWELVRTGGAVSAGEVLLEHAMDLDPAEAWLMRCDRVDFEPGGVALPHRHRGGGIRCLLTGALDVTVGHAGPTHVRPGGAWFESGREPVVARAAADPTSFVRVSILPAAIRGHSSIMYVDPADASRGKPRRYTVWVDAPIEVV